MYKGSDLTMGVMILSKELEVSSVGQLRAEINGRNIVILLTADNSFLFFKAKEVERRRGHSGKFVQGSGC